ncbi:Y-family DNA polymerase [Novosphingobium barchaimii]|uniref:Y-family DNA polymerase n=1 Tax=Novosphingobium barchaimii TaxID=1420591 RepID=UPI000740FC08|nr:DNA polymerase Y family protein [Novosphingobium barchaimii]
MRTKPRRYLALWFPWLPCERASRCGVLPEAAAASALVARDGQALRLAAVGVAAHRQGLSAGMTLADARARCPDLATAPHDPVADSRELDRLAGAMIAFTPLVALDPCDGLVLDVTGCAHLLGGEDELVAGVLAAAGYTVRHALAAHAAAARALARHGTGHDVRALPVAALELDERALSGLRRAGLKTLGDLAARPMAGLAARFGEAAVMRLRAILGEAGSPITPLRLAEPIRLETRFPEPLARTDDALDVIEELLTRAARIMEERQLGGRRFRVVLHRSDNVRPRLVVETGQPVRDPAAVMRLLRERIDTLSDPLDPGYGFDAITLAVLGAEHLPSRQIGLESGKEDAEDSIAALVDTLGVRLGEERVSRLVPCDRHLPEKAQGLVPAAQARPAPWPAGGETPPRPLLLLDPPQPVDVIAGVPDSPPQRFRWQGRLHDVCLAEGPERIGAEWWRKRGGHIPGNAGDTRDYYRIEDGKGRRYWIFRSGLFGETPGPRWYLHGLFP